jgi:hypothetical protein
MNTRYLTKSIACLLAGFSGLTAAEITVPRIIDTDTTWTADNTYLLEQQSFVVTPEGASDPTMLTIEPGTVIKATVSTGTSAAALVVTRGAKIHAEGTTTAPIIFTSELDDLNGNLGPDDQGLWGGVIILGYASTNSRSDSEIVSAPVEDQVEGLELPSEEIEFATFGGTDDDDDSGVIRYVSIRHGGARIGGDNEINGLTLGGVGRNTLVEFVEVFANKDDGVEWFGGTVNARYLAVAFGKDDSFDYDQGWRGNGQYWFTIGNDSSDDRMDKAGEHDGATAPVDAQPFGETRVFNATYIGIGDSLQPDGSPARANTALNIRDNASANYHNSVFLDFAKMIDIENDNETRFDAGDINFTNNVWWSHIAVNNSPEGFNGRPDGNVDPTVFWTDDSRDNEIADPLLAGVSRTADGGLDPRPMEGSPALEGPFATVPDQPFFEQTDYKGAFSKDENWLLGWTKLATEGYISRAPAWIFTDEYGWVYAYNGSLSPDNWIYILALNNLAYIGSDDASGSWLFVQK